MNIEKNLINYSLILIITIGILYFIQNLIQSVSTTLSNIIMLIIFFILIILIFLIISKFNVKTPISTIEPKTLPNIEPKTLPTRHIANIPGSIIHQSEIEKLIPSGTTKNENKHGKEIIYDKVVILDKNSNDGKVIPNNKDSIKKIMELDDIEQIDSKNLNNFKSDKENKIIIHYNSKLYIYNTCEKKIKDIIPQLKK